MNTLVQIIRVDRVNSWSGETEAPVVTRNMIFDDEKSAENFVKEFGTQHGADYKSTYTARIAPTVPPKRYAVMHLVSFDGYEYRLHDHLVNRDNLPPAQEMAFKGDGAYGFFASGEVKELLPGMITNGEYWTTNASLAEDFNKEIKGE